MSKYTRIFSIVAAMLCLSLQVSWSQCDYTLNLYDSFGDGYNGNNVLVSINGGPSTSYTLATGDFGTETFSVSDGDIVAVTFDGSGSFNFEPYFTVEDPSGNIYASFDGSYINDVNSLTFTFVAVCTPNCVSTIDVDDSFGDGLNGAVLELSVTVGGTTYTTAYTGPNVDFTATENADGFAFPVALPPNATVQYNYVGGAFDNEVTVAVSDCDGNVTTVTDPADGTILAFSTPAGGGGGGTPGGMAIPTMGEWGLIFFGLFSALLGFVFVYRLETQRQLSTTNGASAYLPKASMFPFEADVFRASVKTAVGIAIAAFVVILAVWGEITMLDVAMMTIVVPMVAYMIHIAKLLKK